MRICIIIYTFALQFDDKINNCNEKIKQKVLSSTLLITKQIQLKMKNEWRGFKGNHWTEDIDVRAFIQDNYTAYDGNADFLAGPTEATNKLWTLLQGLQKEERAKGGVLDMGNKSRVKYDCLSCSLYGRRNQRT